MLSQVVLLRFARKTGGKRSSTLLGTNISHQKVLLKIIFLFPRWDMLVPGG